ncbi:MAG: hypothetical protein U0795_15695 [Pirellulales bacterium]
MKCAKNIDPVGLQPVEYEYRCAEYEYRGAEYEYRGAEYEYRGVEYEYRCAEYEYCCAEYEESAEWGRTAGAGVQNRRYRAHECGGAGGRASDDGRRTEGRIRP